MKGSLVYSKTGHDKNKMYIVINENQNYVLLSDGVQRKWTNPKKKNAKHVQVISKEYDKELQQRIILDDSVRDEEIKRAIKIYKASI